MRVPQVLYISYTGVLEPLGQSQVLQYVIGLAREHSMTLLTFERPGALKDTVAVQAIEKQCRDAGVKWQRRIYHRSLAVTVWDILIGTLVGIRLVRESDVDIVHSRSYIAGMMAMVIKRVTGARMIFDMRGFWPDERADGGIWQCKSRRYRFFKWIEKHLFLTADHVVSLTHAGIREFSRFDYLQDRLPPASMIPTCTNLDLFRPASPDEYDSESKSFTLGYVGSAGSWYLFDEVARAVRLLFDARPDARFAVFNKGGHDAIRDCLSAAGVDLARVDILAVPYEQVGKAIAQVDAGIFFIKPVWSKKASCPTRMGEFLACGKPCLANANVGDVEAYLLETGTGIALHELSDDCLHRGLMDIVALAAEPDIAGRCRLTAENTFLSKPA
jgi:glycosyltransferase involved in cell wall biosynthesis